MPTYFVLKVFEKTTRVEYSDVMETNRHSIHYDMGADVYETSERTKKRRSDSFDLLTKEPGLTIGTYDTSYMDITLDDRRNKVPELIDRIWSYVAEKEPIVDSLSIMDLKSIYRDCAPDPRIVITEDELETFLSEHQGRRMFCFFGVPWEPW